MSFTRFAEIGRVCLINYGPHEGKLCTIVDIVDGNRALIDGPVSITGVDRQMINFRRLSLTDYVVKVGRNARHKSLKKAWEAAGIQGKWEASTWGRRVASRSERKEKTDFDRFVSGLKRQTRNKAIRAKLGL